jgi:putative PIN family toxin of toxin-antitoxin system
MRVVLDTSVIVAGLRSPSGAAAELLRRVLAGELEAAATTALLLEYEAVVMRPEHLRAAALSRLDAMVVIDALAGAMREVSIRWRMRPASPDPGDDLVVEAAVNAGVDILVTFNRRDLDAVCASAGIRTTTPAVLLLQLGRSQ